MANFTIVDGQDGEFGLKALPCQTLTDTEQAYTDALKRIMTKMKRDIADDPSGSDEGSVALRQARTERRKQALKEMRDEANECLEGRLDPDIAADNAFVIRGKYRADLDRQTNSFFLVEPLLVHGKVEDVIVHVSEDLPIRTDPAAQAKQGLYVALDNARTVVKTVARRLEDRAERWWHRKATKEKDQARARRLREEYMGKLVEIGKLGLQNPHVELGNLALNGFRADFVAQEAGRIKNSYLRSLGLTGGLVAAAFFGVYGLVKAGGYDANGFWNTHWVFLFAGAGAAIGTWLSFSIRRVTLGFDDLGILEEDRLDPSVRVIFVVALTMVICLLFWTGAMNLEIGNLKTSGLVDPSSKLPLGAIALLIGIFCGIAERALATAISGRAAAFVKSVGT
jgi:hypothetical protein